MTCAARLFHRLNDLRRNGDSPWRVLAKGWTAAHPAASAAAQHQLEGAYAQDHGCCRPSSSKKEAPNRVWSGGFLSERQLEAKATSDDNLLRRRKKKRARKNSPSM